MKNYKSFNTKEKCIYNIIRVIGIVLCLIIAHYFLKLFNNNFNFIYSVIKIMLVPFQLIPMITSIYGFINFLLGIILCDLAVLTLTYLISFPFVSLFFSIVNTKLNILKDDTSFLSEQDIHYYRELLNDVKPYEMSLIMNMKLEKDKDVVANILYLKNRNIIKENNGKIIFNDKLSKIDNDFKNFILDKNFFHWEQCCIKETINNGYIKYKTTRKKIIIINIILATIFSIGLYFSNNNINIAFSEEENIVMENMTIESFNSPIILHISIKLLISYISLLFMISTLVIPIYSIIANIILFKNRRKLVRTKKGRELSTKVLGLKRFIHDFSNLEDKKKEELVLWKDYLVYAVILEENEQIIKEIENLWSEKFF